jgi:DNA-binding response OmpR family regulator
LSQHIAAIIIHRKEENLSLNDEPDMTTMLKMTLEHEGFIVDTFNDPMQALKSYKPRLYDLVLLDVIMPKMTASISILS